MLGLLVAGFSLWEERSKGRPQSDVGGRVRNAAAIPADCYGQHAVCERDRLRIATGEKPEYYDDEELDAYRGTASDAYPEEATEIFRDVLYTLRETEVADWLRSLQLRGVHLPDTLKDEAFLIVEEQYMEQMNV